jgi:hypothetical protein
MATYSASQAKYITLSANTVDTITLTGTGNTLRAITTSGTAFAYYTVGGLGETVANPTVGGDNTYPTVHGNPGYIDIPWKGNSAVVKVISTGTPTVGFILI